MDSILDKKSSSTIIDSHNYKQVLKKIESKKEFKFDVDTINYTMQKEKLKDIINLKDKSII